MSLTLNMTVVNILTTQSAKPIRFPILYSHFIKGRVTPVFRRSPWRTCEHIHGSLNTFFADCKIVKPKWLRTVYEDDNDDDDEIDDVYVDNYDGDDDNDDDNKYDDDDNADDSHV